VAVDREKVIKFYDFEDRVAYEVQKEAKEKI